MSEVLEDVEVGLHDFLDPRPADLQSDRCGRRAERARWTCEIEAEATGTGSIAANTCDGGRPYSSVKIASASSYGKGRTSSRRAESSLCRLREADRDAY